MKFLVLAMAMMALFSTASDFVVDYAEELELAGKKGENLALITGGWDTWSNKAFVARSEMFFDGMTINEFNTNKGAITEEVAHNLGKSVLDVTLTPKSASSRRRRMSDTVDVICEVKVKTSEEATELETKLISPEFLNALVANIHKINSSLASVGVKVIAYIPKKAIKNCEEGQELNESNECVDIVVELDAPQIIKFSTEMFSKIGDGWCTSTKDGTKTDESHSQDIDDVDMKECAKRCLRSADCVAYAFADRYQQNGFEYIGMCELYDEQANDYGVDLGLGLFSSVMTPTDASAHFHVRSSTGEKGVGCYKKMDTNVIVEPPSMMFIIIGVGICVDAEDELPNGKMIDSKNPEECRQECIANASCSGYSTVKAGTGRCFIFGKDEINNNIPDAVDYEDSFPTWAAFSGKVIKIKHSDGSYPEFICHRSKTPNEVLGDIDYVFSKIGRGKCDAAKNTEHKTITGITKKDCFLDCEFDTICTGFDYDSVTAICETYAYEHNIDYIADKTHVCYVKYEHGKTLKKSVKKNVNLEENHLNELQVSEYSETEIGYAKKILIGLFIILSSLVIYDQVRKRYVRTNNDNNSFFLVDQEEDNMTPYYQKQDDRI